MSAKIVRLGVRAEHAVYTVVSHAGPLTTRTSFEIVARDVRARTRLP